MNINPKMATQTTSKGTMVSRTKYLNASEIGADVKNAAIQAYTVCTPIGIIAKARFNAWSNATLCIDIIEPSHNADVNNLFVEGSAS
jgi:hypothetical protein